ncbi:fumarate hydratase C-terminal domain-containing protein [Klebsiella pneumoniae]
MFLRWVGYPVLGLEAIWIIEVVDFPAFFLVDVYGNVFFQQFLIKLCAGC